MATRYFCDHCGSPAIVRQKSNSQMGYTNNIGLPILSFGGTKIEIVILKDDQTTDSSMCYDQARDKIYGDICRRCLLTAIEEGIERSDG